MKIIHRFNQLQQRKAIPKYEKTEIKNNDSNVINTKKKKIYDYYKCDYCNDEIRLDIKKCERSGGVVVLPHTLTKRGELQLALCNKCLNKVIAEFLEK